jgi:purine-cytosine permease-like protein
MSGLLGSLRRLIFGETWTIPLAVGAALAAALLMRAELSESVWRSVGGFGLAVTVIAALAWSRRRPG